MTKAAPIHNHNSPGSQTDLATDGKLLPVPNAPGKWLYTLANKVLRVERREGKLVFPAGEWQETETAVASLAAMRAPNSRHGFVRVFPIIDI